ncbi:glycolate oxidase subunit GlcF [Acidihalobacter ferrooxydans]|uniref:Glycolate oxidase iron-sulfur subunit n=1 Tax=Acidihalobacter ferrooxydans TaxID=1765967 RepID=A0A1P8UE14_9GAMM|nr:glycolate oxidase subunit GlcF [Acidihalobacter ferrooxydans]APZ42004.1 glycolate oxidase iron-sulfur subunit [Acidihalobacter ferrooxydans]
MQTHLTEQFLNTPEGQEADAILRACVHCGFCTATCPTYQLLGDELDGPRGRIYQLKQVFEGVPAGRSTQLHLDRCLSCRACETTCPSGVRYGRLADLGREVIERQVARPWRQRILRYALRKVLPRPRLFGPLLRLGQLARPLLPTALRARVPPAQPVRPRPQRPHPRTLLALEGCVQSAATPATNDAAARVLDRLGIRLLSPAGQGCCGAVSHHLSASDEALDYMRANIDAWWPAIEDGAEAIVISASGCATVVKDYGHLLRHDPAYADKAARVSLLARDLAEVLAAEDLSGLSGLGAGRRIAFHAPCTLQHGQRIVGVVERILSDAGFELSPVSDAHLCCGSAGTYSILQPELAQRLRADKLSKLAAGAPELIATANVGCQLHLQAGGTLPVRHWIELLDEASGAAS